VRQIAGGTIQQRPSDKRGGHADPNALAKHGYRNNGLRKQLWRWRINGEGAVTILREVAPYLASKKRQRAAIKAIQQFEKRQIRETGQTQQ
jgi:hypothetical protein